MTTPFRRSVLPFAAALGLGALITPVAHAAAPALVTYAMSANWGSGFQAELTITPSTAVTSWTVEFDAGDQQRLTLAAYAGATQTGRHITLVNRSFNGTIAAGGTVQLVLQFSNPTLSDAPPAGFTLNGQPAAYTPQPYILADNAHPAVPEGGSTTVGVTLSQPPSTTVTLQVGGGGTAAVMAAPGSLTFTPADWNVPQMVTLTSPPDTDTTDQTAWIPIEQWGGSPFYAYAVLLATQLDNGQP